MYAYFFPKTLVTKMSLRNSSSGKSSWELEEFVFGDNSSSGNSSWGEVLFGGNSSSGNSSSEFVFWGGTSCSGDWSLEFVFGWEFVFRGQFVFCKFVFGIRLRNSSLSAQWVRVSGCFCVKMFVCKDVCV